MSTPVVAPPLRRALDEALGKVRPGKRGRVGAAITLDGVEFDLGFKPKPSLDVAGYVSKQWSRRGWTAGARVGFDF